MPAVIGAMPNLRELLSPIFLFFFLRWRRYTARLLHCSYTRVTVNKRERERLALTADTQGKRTRVIARWTFYHRQTIYRGVSFSFYFFGKSQKEEEDWNCQRRFCQRLSNHCIVLLRRRFGRSQRMSCTNSNGPGLKGESLPCKARGKKDPSKIFFQW